MSLFYKISKPGHCISYLYGTIHIQNPKVFKYVEELLPYIRECEVYSPEMVIDQVDGADFNAGAMLAENKSLSALLGESQREKLRLFVDDNLGQPIEMFDRYKPIVLAFEIVRLFIADGEGDSLDSYLLRSARSQNRKIVGLESFHDQLNTLNDIPIDEQINYLMGMVDNMEQYRQEYLEIVDAYLQEDVDKMLAIMRQSAISDVMYQILNTSRNITMADRIVEMTRENQVFYAFGAGHFAGDEGVVGLLRNRGFVIEPISFL
jgi:hypothetical protein